jgi:hypothetical protein
MITRIADGTKSNVIKQHFIGKPVEHHNVKSPAFSFSSRSYVRAAPLWLERFA